MSKNSKQKRTSMASDTIVGPTFFQKRFEEGEENRRIQNEEKINAEVKRILALIVQHVDIGQCTPILDHCQIPNLAIEVLRRFRQRGYTEKMINLSNTRSEILSEDQFKNQEHGKKRLLIHPFWLPQETTTSTPQ